MSKKTESIEIRLSPELKAAFSRISQGREATMSETMRALIEGEVAGKPTPKTGDPIMLKSTTTRLMRAAVFALPVLVLAFVYLVSAQAPATAFAEIRVSFAEFDADADDAITLPEVQAALVAEGWSAAPDCAARAEHCTLDDAAAFHLARADADGSGEVSFPEFEAVMMRERAEEFLDADIDGNGVITRDEIVAIELHRLVGDADAMPEELAALSPACLARFQAEQLSGLAATCGFEAEARAELAQFDADRSGSVSLMEYLGR